MRRPLHKKRFFSCYGVRKEKKLKKKLIIKNDCEIEYIIYITKK